jgi:hypothetical protein
MTVSCDVKAVRPALVRERGSDGRYRNYIGSMFRCKKANEFFRENRRAGIVPERPRLAPSARPTKSAKTTGAARRPNYDERTTERKYGT